MSIWREYDKLNSLMAQLLAEDISDQELSELQSILSRSADARTFYCEHILTDVLLDWCSNSAIEQSSNGNGQFDRSNKLQHQIPADENPSVDYNSTVDRIAANLIGQRGFEGPNCNGHAQSEAKPIVKQVQFNDDSQRRSVPIVLAPLGSFGNIVGSHPVIFGVFAVIAVCIATWLFRGQGNAVLLERHVQPKLASGRAADPKAADYASESFAAKLVAGVDCRWDPSDQNLTTGTDLPIGQTLQLVAGVAQIRFGVGVNVLLQGPASFAIESAKGLRVDKGKLTAEILTEQARGFKVITNEATYIDQGTEFGVEVTRSGNSSIHVFKGTVDVDLKSKSQPNLPEQRLTADHGARLDDDLSRITFVEDTGETFIRSLNEAERDQHVLAYWRFEDHPIGSLVPDTGFNTQPMRGTIDSSFNGNDLFTYSAGNQPVFSSDVAQSLVPQSGRSNQSCLDNTKRPSSMPTRDLYTMSYYSHSSPIDIQQITPVQWTIEASVKVKDLKSRPQTFVGRDGSDPNEDLPARLAFQLNENDRFALHFIDVNYRVHEVVADDFVVAESKWYNVVAVSDARTLKLYVDSIDGKGYRLIASTNLPESGSNALGNGSDGAEWTIGRGKVNGKPREWFQGWIDEVRISDIALEPSKFLFSKPKPAAGNEPTVRGAASSKAAETTEMQIRD